MWILGLLRVAMPRSSRGIACVERAWKMRVQEERTRSSNSRSGNMDFLQKLGEQKEGKDFVTCNCNSSREHRRTRRL